MRPFFPRQAPPSIYSHVECVSLWPDDKSIWLLTHSLTTTTHYLFGWVLIFSSFFVFLKVHRFYSNVTNDLNIIQTGFIHNRFHYPGEQCVLPSQSTIGQDLVCKYNNRGSLKISCWYCRDAWKVISRMGFRNKSSGVGCHCQLKNHSQDRLLFSIIANLLKERHPRLVQVIL